MNIFSILIVNLKNDFLFGEIYKSPDKVFRNKLVASSGLIFWFMLINLYLFNDQVVPCCKVDLLDIVASPVDRQTFHQILRNLDLFQIFYLPCEKFSFVTFAIWILMVTIYYVQAYDLPITTQLE
jgi:hypothetical protein